MKCSNFVTLSKILKQLLKNVTTTHLQILEGGRAPRFCGFADELLTIFEDFGEGFEMFWGELWGRSGAHPPLSYQQMLVL